MVWDLDGRAAEAHSAPFGGMRESYHVLCAALKFPLPVSGVCASFSFLSCAAGVLRPERYVSVPPCVSLLALLVLYVSAMCVFACAWCVLCVSRCPVPQRPSSRFPRPRSPRDQSMRLGSAGKTALVSPPCGITDMSQAMSQAMTGDSFTASPIQSAIGMEKSAHREDEETTNTYTRCVR